MLKKYRLTARGWKVLIGLSVLLWNFFLIFLWELTGIFNKIPGTTMMWIVFGSMGAIFTVASSTILEFNKGPYFNKIKD